MSNFPLYFWSTSVNIIALEEGKVQFGSNWVERGLYSILNGDADLSINHLVPTNEPYKIGLAPSLNFLHSNFEGTKMFLIFQQPPLSQIKNLYLLPFSPILWGMAVGFIVGIQGLISVCNRNWNNLLISIVGNASLQGK